MKVINEISLDKRARFDRSNDVARARARACNHVNADASLRLRVKFFPALKSARIDLSVRVVSRGRVLMLAYVPPGAIRSLSGA